MKFTQAIFVALAAMSVTEVAAQRNNRNGGNNGDVASSSSSAAAAATSTATDNGGGNGGTGTTGNDPNAVTLDPSAIQTGSQSAGGAVAEAGQSDSAKDDANFINFCANGQKGTLTNGLQVQGGSCNGIPMGRIPSTSNMVSSIMRFPTGKNDNLKANEAFTIRVKIDNLAAGVFTNPQTTYYSAPQDLTGGNIIGHTHVTVQDCGGSLPETPLDPGTFAFFKGINTPIDNQGELTADVTQGLPAGLYRVCTLTAAANHQPVLMPVAQRGGQDDCRYFTVGDVGGNGGATAVDETASTGGGDGNAGKGGSSTSNSNVAVSSSAADAAATSSAAATDAASATSTASASTGTTTSTGGNQGGGRGGRGGQRGRGRFMARAYIA